MKTFKLTYQTNAGLIFNTIIHANNEDECTGFMAREYAFDQIKILKIRPSVKQGYKKVCNYQVK
jgi:hypothetical protein